MKVRSCCGLLCVALILALASAAYAQEFRATIKGTVADTSQAALPGATVTVAEPGNQRNGDGRDQRRRRLHHSLPPARRLFADGGDERVPEEHAHEPAAFSRRDGKHQRSAGRRPDRDGQRRVGNAAARDQQGRPRHGHRQRAHRRAAAAVAQPDGARRARRRRQLQRPGHLPAAVRQRRARRLVDERRPEQQQRVPARRRAEQRQPGRQQHRLRAAGGSRAGNEDLHQLLRRAVRPHRRRRRQHVAEVGHQQVPRRGLRLHAAQGPGRQLVPPQLAPGAEDRSVHRSVRVQRRRPDLEEQDVLPVHRREVPGRHARPAVQHGADGGDEERRFQRSRGRVRAA